MIGAIIGDICGSVYELNNTKDYNLKLFDKESRFTDDTVMMLAVSDAIIHKKRFVDNLQYFGRKYPNAGYGGNFFYWIFNDKPKPYNSYGNGSAMRSIAVGYLYDCLDSVQYNAKLSAEITHNHIEGIKGAQAVASCIYLAKTNHSKKQIKEYIENRFNYDLNQTYERLNKEYTFDVSCQGSVPQAIVCFLESDNFEDALRKAISIGGDSDTIACITCGISEAFYKDICIDFVSHALNLLDDFLVQKLKEFYLFSCSPDVFHRVSPRKDENLQFKCFKSILIARKKEFEDLTSISMDTHGLLSIDFELKNLLEFLMEIVFILKIEKSLSVNFEISYDTNNTIDVRFYNDNNSYIMNIDHSYLNKEKAFLGLINTTKIKSESNSFRFNDLVDYLIEIEKSINNLKC